MIRNITMIPHTRHTPTTMDHVNDRPSYALCFRSSCQWEGWKNRYLCYRNLYKDIDDDSEINIALTILLVVIIVVVHFIRVSHLALFELSIRFTDVANGLLLLL